MDTGGWWHDVRILAATGAGQEKEEPRAWDGWWNEQIVELVQLTTKQPGALCVLLTGRSEQGYSDLLQRMINSKKLEFDLIALKPAVGPNNEQFKSTMAFKQAFLKALMETYASATEIRIYEDRPRHVTGFRNFLVKYNEDRQQRLINPLPPIKGEVIHVVENATSLDSVIEVAEVQHMVNRHNAALDGKEGRLLIKRTVNYTGYMIQEADTTRLLKFLQLPPEVNGRDVKFHANCIIITTRVCPPHLLAKTGGMGSKMMWRVTEVGGVGNGVWAVKVRPTVPGTPYHTLDGFPMVILAVRRTFYPQHASRIRNWTPVPANEVFEFETTIGEKATLCVESEVVPEPGDRDSYEGQAGRQPPHKRQRGSHNLSYNTSSAVHRQPAAYGGPSRGAGGQYGSSAGVRGSHSASAGRGRGGQGGSRGNHRVGNGASTRGGRGGPATGGPADPKKPVSRTTGHYQYQSMDDVGASTSPQFLPRQKIVYDDSI
ncbi:MAG: Protein-lysine N-methyltransferase efm5 [Sporothrix epigloea]